MTALRTVIRMDVLDADNLLSAVTQASKNLNLGCISPHQGGTVQRLMGARVWAPATGRPVPDLLP
jgi:hypothetical protein